MFLITMQITPHMSNYDSTALVMIKPRKHQKSIVAGWCRVTIALRYAQSTVFGKVNLAFSKFGKTISI